MYIGGFSSLRNGGTRGITFFFKFYYDNTDMAQHDLIKGFNVFFPNFALHTFSPNSVLSELKQQGSTKVKYNVVFL